MVRRAARWVGCWCVLATGAFANTPYGVRFDSFDPPTSIVSSAVTADFQAALQIDVTALLLYVDEVRTPGLVTLTIGNPVLKTGSVMVSAPGWVEFVLAGPAPTASVTLPVTVNTSTADLTLRHLQVQWYATDYPAGSNPNPPARLLRDANRPAMITGVFRLASGTDPLAEPGCPSDAVSGSPYAFGEWVPLDAGSQEQLTFASVTIHPGFMGLLRFDPLFRGLPDWSVGVPDGGSHPIGSTVQPHPAFVPDTWPRPGHSPPFRMIASGSGEWLRLNAGPGLDVCHAAVRASFGGQRARAVGAAPGSDFVITTTLAEAFLQCRDDDRDGSGTVCMMSSATAPGWARTGGDCDDTNAAIFPGAPETCDSIDNDCDALIDADDPQLERPLCANQTGLCSNSRNTPSTCVNGAFLACTDASYGPSFGRSEAMCGSLDFNCDGMISRAIPCALQLGVCSGVTFTDCTPGARCGGDEYGPDFEVDETRCDGLDNDCDGTPDDVPMKSCTLQLGVCAGATTTPDLCLTTGFAECGADQYGPDWEAIERSCDGKDNDCDGFTDAFDTGCELQRGVCAGAQHLSPRCSIDTLERCGSADYGPTWEAEEQRCDRLDNDCDGVTDEGCERTNEETVPPTGCGCGAIDSVLLLSSLVFLARRRRVT